MGIFRDGPLGRWRESRPADRRDDAESPGDQGHPDRTGLRLGVADAPSAPDVPYPLSGQRILRWFDANDFGYFVDSDGDLGGIWRGRLFYFFLFGENSEILQCRGQWNRNVAIERLEELLDFCNEWNAERIWPKAYARVRDNGIVHIISEVATDLEHGATDEQLSQLLFCGLSTGTMLFDSLDELYPDPVGLAP
jgi:Putative bacterial sensory transduction regulator